MGGVVMTQEDKSLLLKDLCARLPYGIKCEYDNLRYGGVFKVTDIRYNGYIDGVIDNKRCWAVFDPLELKPYLFPLSSMTEEQKKEILKGYNLHTYGLCIEITNHSEGYWDDDNSCNLQDYLWLVDWFNKNHFDYRGLIEKGLAIDATGLNIY